MTPHFTAYKYDNNILTYNPQLGWYTFENEWPLHCINCQDSLIDKEQAHSNISWFITPSPSPIYYINGDPFVWITNCIAKNWKVADLATLGMRNCQICPPPTTVPVTQNVLQIPSPPTHCDFSDHELRIWVESYDKGPLYNDHCLNVDAVINPVVNGMGTGNNYAIFSKVAGFDYYKKISYPNDELRIIKVAHPIVDYKHFGVPPLGPFVELEGDVLTLCDNGTPFESLSSVTWQPNVQQFRYSNAYGGVYSIFRPGIPGIKHLYVAYPWAEGLWFNGSPDLTINYDDQTDWNPYPSGLCEPSTRLDKLELYDICADLFSPCANAVFGSALGNATDYIVNTDYNTIANYWKDNVITIGFKSGGNAANNYYDFEASNNPPIGCSLPGGAQLIQQFTLNSAGEYEVEKPARINNLPIQPGTNLYIHVTAQFTNGEYINETKCVVVNNNAIHMATIQFRGNVSDYDPNVTNYEVTIYH